jgi:hypothetical protein
MFGEVFLPLGAGEMADVKLMAYIRGIVEPNRAGVRVWATWQSRSRMAGGGVGRDVS